MNMDKTCKQLYDSIKSTRVRSKELCDALTNQVNQKSVEIFDLNANLHEQGLIIVALKDELRNLKGKALVDNAIIIHIIAPEMLKVNVEPVAPRLLNNRTVHSDYLRLTQEQAHFKLNVNSELICVKYNGCMLFDNHDLYVPNVINDVNASSKSKSALKHSKRKVWKPTGKVFTKIGYTWRPTGKSKKKPYKPKSEDTSQEELYLLYMDLYGPISKDEALEFIIKFLKMIQVQLKTLVHRFRTDNGTESVNQTFRDYYEKVGISHETSVARSLQQNGVIERRNRTLIEAARTMLIYAKSLLFLWAEAVANMLHPKPFHDTSSSRQNTI
nr:hypothetical protein [Tanacetum cinerariifolium]